MIQLLQEFAILSVFVQHISDICSNIDDHLLKIQSYMDLRQNRVTLTQ